MSVVIAERRRNLRVSASFHVVICDRRGRQLARGRTANISESGLFIVIDSRFFPEANSEVQVHVTLPTLRDAGRKGNRREPSRTVVYACRIVRSQRIGQMIGLGIEFLRKLA